MMTFLFLFGGIFLAFIFGRNNFANIFGTAVGTKLISLKLATFLTGIFLLLGAYFNSSATSSTLSDFAHFTTLSESCFFSVIVTFIMMLLTYLGIPASVAQIAVGALIGWNLALNLNIVWNTVVEIILGWLYSPVIACVTAFIIFKVMRFLLQKYPIPLLSRHLWVKGLWLLVGTFTAYCLGANNMPVLVVPFYKVLPEISLILVFGFSIVAGMGCLAASQKVIKTLSSKLFPLSTLESLIVGFSSALTLLLFSFQNGFLPALPISIGAAMIGAIVGVSLAKGGYGLRLSSLFVIVLSWIWAPLFSGLLSYIFILIMKFRGI